MTSIIQFFGSRDVSGCFKFDPLLGSVDVLRGHPFQTIHTCPNCSHVNTYGLHWITDYSRAKVKFDGNTRKNPLVVQQVQHGRRLDPRATGGFTLPNQSGSGMLGMAQPRNED